MEYLTNLEWQTRLSEFDDNQQKVLLALSHNKFEWRTKDRLQEVTGLSANNLDDCLSALIAKELVRPSFSKKRQLIFGLRERVR
jgi:hypothetical protein